MDSKKEKLLKKAYTDYLDLMLYDFPIEKISEVIDDDVKGYGTTIDEKLIDISRVKKIVIDQREQGAGIEINVQHMPIHQRISPEGDTVVYTDEFTLSMKLKEGDHILHLRLSSVFEFSLEKWKVVHIHGSTGVVTEENDTWHKEEWKKKNEELQSLVEEKTAELLKQNRELEIEAALERIRSQVTAMRESSELLDIVVMMQAEFTRLGHEAHYFWHMRWLPDKYEKALTNGDGTRIGNVLELPRGFHGLQPMLDWEKSDNPSGVFALDPETAADYIDKMIKMGRFQEIDHNAPGPEEVHAMGGLTFVMARTTHGEIGYTLPGEVPNPPDQDIATLVRFASVFDLAYRRFVDITKAEARAREAIKQASLDRIRGQIAGMRNSEDLQQQITPLIWKELKVLDVPFFRCGVFLLDDKIKHMQAYLTTPDGKPLGVLDLGFEMSDLTRNIVSGWRKKYVHQTHWNRDEFKAWTHEMMKLRQIETPEKYQGAETPPESLHLHFIPFTQGMLYIGNGEPLDDEKIELLKSLAQAFSFAYSRYEDFVILEESKERLEQTLNDLRATQSQLIHAEKMASLGELTAGIAHEIRNPLNFVNNFSDVSVDLLGELREEVLAGNNEEVSAIMEDLKQNLEKITDHGKRASGIVKGMLEHSRTGSAEKQATDIKAIADEYLRLAYHGLRAKDKSFNADFKLVADNELPKVSIVGQDIGRVLLNLINNAFYAVSEKAKQNLDGYKPQVIVTLRNLAEHIEIRIKDNGNGIPENIKEKIFQPFFTTKPSGQGTGLGLSMSYDIITKGHGGKMDVVSITGEGAEFIILIPKTQ